MPNRTMTIFLSRALTAGFSKCSDFPTNLKSGPIRPVGPKWHLGPFEWQGPVHSRLASSSKIKTN